MKSSFVVGMVAGTLVSAALMSMYVGENPQEAVRMSRKMNHSIKQMNPMNLF